MFYTATVTSQGQVTIPAKIRKKLGIQKNSTITFKENAQGEIVMQPQRNIRDVIGIAQIIKPLPKDFDLLQTIKEATQEYADEQSEKYFNLKDED